MRLPGHTVGFNFLKVACSWTSYRSKGSRHHNQICNACSPNCCMKNKDIWQILLSTLSYQPTFGPGLTLKHKMIKISKMVETWRQTLLSV